VGVINVKQGKRGLCNLSIRILTDKLFDFKLFKVPLQNRSLIKKTSSLQRMVLCLALMAKGSLSCSVCCDMVPRFMWCQVKDRPI
jgi:hypothetical protein